MKNLFLIKFYKNRNITWHVNMFFPEPSRNHEEMVKITNSVIIPKKLTYSRNNCEEYPIECSTII